MDACGCQQVMNFGSRRLEIHKFFISGSALSNFQPSVVICFCAFVVACVLDEVLVSQLAAVGVAQK